MEFVEEEAEEKGRCDGDSQIEEKTRGHKSSLGQNRSLRLKHFPTDNAGAARNSLELRMGVEDCYRVIMKENCSFVEVTIIIV